MGHRAPAKRDSAFGVGDLRMYVGAPLSDDAIRTLATADASRRDCTFPYELRDSGTFRDINQHGCEWYQSRLAMGDSTELCMAPEVRRSCPIACVADEPCFQGLTVADTAPRQRISTRVLRLDVPASQPALTCLRQNSDAVARCYALREAADPRSYPPPGMTLDPDRDWHGYLEEAASLSGTRAPVFDVTDCAALRDSIYPYCRFEHGPSRGLWMDGMDRAVVDSGDEMTISFWIKPQRASMAADFRPLLSLFGSVAPPRPLLTFFTSDSDAIRVVLWNRCSPPAGASPARTCGEPHSAATAPVVSRRHAVRSS